MVEHLGGVHLGNGDQQDVALGRVARRGGGARSKTGERHSRIDPPRAHGRRESLSRTGEGEGELVEEGPAHVGGHSGKGAEGSVQVMRTLEAELAALAETLGPEQGQVDGGRERTQSLIGADIGGRFGPADMLLAGLEGQGVTGLAVRIGGLRHQAAGELAHMGRPATHEAHRWAAERGRVAKHLSVADDYVGPQNARCLEDSQSTRFDRHHQQRAGGVGRAGQRL